MANSQKLVAGLHPSHHPLESSNMFSRILHFRRLVLRSFSPSPPHTTQLHATQQTSLTCKDKMRILKTATLEMVEFHTAPFPSFAIPSQTWDAPGTETTYQDMRTPKMEAVTSTSISQFTSSTFPGNYHRCEMPSRARKKSHYCSPRHNPKQHTWNIKTTWDKSQRRSDTNQRYEDQIPVSRTPPRPKAVVDRETRDIKDKARDQHQQVAEEQGYVKSLGQLMSDIYFDETESDSLVILLTRNVGCGLGRGSIEYAAPLVSMGARILNRFMS